MASGKRYYWIKLKESFMTSDAVDYLMSQPNGAQYVVLYQMLCLKTINTDGRLSRQIGEMIIPYDVDKIQRDCKWFSTDTIRVALNMFKAFGLIYEDVDGTLVMADHENLVGSETDWAIRKKIQRENNQQALPPADEGMDNVHANVPQLVHEENRDKRLEIRDKDIRDKEGENGTRKARFAPPTMDEVKAYVQERGSNVDPVRFWTYYNEGGWKDAKGNPVRNWKQKLITWEGREPDVGTKPVLDDSEALRRKWNVHYDI